MKQGKTKAAKPPTTNKHLIRWVEKMAELTQPAAIYWVDGSQKEYDRLCDEMVASKTLIRLNQKTWPDAFMRAPIRAMWLALRIVHISVLIQKIMRGRQTTGSIRMRCGRS